jgi:hypothetical protein
MELCNNFQQVIIATTSSTAPRVLLAASTGQVPCLNALHMSMTGAASLVIQSETTSTGSTGPVNLTGAMPAAANGQFDWELEKTVQGCLRGIRGGNLQLLSTGTTYRGYAIVSQTTQVAT